MDGAPGEIRVLHVDDDTEFVRMAAAFLERENERITVDVATSVSEGIERLDGGTVDCVVSDYDMPERNGLEFLQAVRETRPDLPFILFTGKGSEEVASDAISAGATDYLQKGGTTEQYELLANRVLNAVDQYQSRRRAAELDRIRTLASDVNQALVRATSREEMASRVCEILAASDPYLFAWVGDLDTDTNRVVPRASAGVDEGYLDGLTVTADDTPTGQGPIGTALREGRVAVSQNVAADPEFEPWRDDALERGYRASAAVPLEYAETLYGVLGVYAARPDAFDADERNLLAELGDDVAHAFHSLDVRDRLRRERDQRQALFENAPGPVISGSVRDEAFPITAVNDAFRDVFGYDADAAVGSDVADLIVPESGAARHAEFRERTAAGEPTVEEVERVTTDGPRQFLLTIIPYGLDTTPVDGWYAWYTDISARRKREGAIEELHRTVEALMGAATTGAIADITVDAVRDVLGMPANAIHLYDECEDALPPVAWTAEVEALVDEVPTFRSGDGLAWTVFESGEPQTYSDVSTVPGRFESETNVRSEILLPLDDFGVLLIGSGEPDAFDETDVSLAQTLAAHVTTALERTEREAELTRRRSLLEAVLEASIDGILVVDENREYVTWNQQFVDMWDVPAELAGDEPEDLGLEWVLDRLERPDEFVDKVEHLYAHPHEESRDRIRLADGRVFDRYSAPVEADDGTHFGRVWFFRDITERERHEAELARQNEQLEEFVSIVSHDLRNPLSVVRARLELAREEYDSAHLDSAVDAVDRSFALIDDLLTLARRGEDVRGVDVVSLPDTVRDCWHTVETADATLVVETDRDVRADVSRLKQLFENLFRNSVEHSSTSSQPRADDAVAHGSAGNRTESGSAGVTVTVGDLADGFYVADDGPGIPVEDRERVFEAGYSTSEMGTGFGLNIVHDVADAHGWEVEVTESESGGARFEVTGVEFA